MPDSVPPSVHQRFQHRHSQSALDSGRWGIDRAADWAATGIAPRPRKQQMSLLNARGPSIAYSASQQCSVAIMMFAISESTQSLELDICVRGRSPCTPPTPDVPGSPVHLSPQPATVPLSWQGVRQPCADQRVDRASEAARSVGRANLEARMGRRWLQASRSTPAERGTHGGQAVSCALPRRRVASAHTCRYTPLCERASRGSLCRIRTLL